MAQRIARVSFDGKRTYDYATNLILEIGEFVVVDSANGLGIAQVVDPDVPEQVIRNWEYKPILDRIDINGLRQRFAEQERASGSEDYLD